VAIRKTAQINERPGAWAEVPADFVGDAIVAAMALGGVDHLFFVSGTEIGFYQEAIAKARALGRPTPRLITLTHEIACLNAALGYTAVSGKPSATAAHVDVGTQHYGGGIHTAWRSGLPVLITAGAPPASYPGSMPGSRDGGHLWLQQVPDQNGIVRQYMKWDHRLEYQDNPGLIVSRALQVARSEPTGPVYLSVPREISLLPMKGARFPSADQLGIPRPLPPEPEAVSEIAQRLVAARNPFVVVAGSGRNPLSVPALVKLCELLAIPVVNAAWRGYQCFPMNHPLYQTSASLKDADAVLVLDAQVPWIPGPNGPGEEAYIAVVDTDPIKSRIPTFEFTADVRLAADSLLTIAAIEAAASCMLSAADRRRIEERAERWSGTSRAARQTAEREALAKSSQQPIDPAWVSYQLAQVLDDNCIVLDESIPQDSLTPRYLALSRPGSYFTNPGSCGGWSLGAALGAKLAAPDRDVVAVAGDGFYMFGVPAAALWSSAHHRAPFLAVVYHNRSYSTGTTLVNNTFPNGYAARGGFEGGYFDPAIDFAKEAQAAGAYGENVSDPAQVEPALRRGLAEIRQGRPAVISMRLARLLQND
jgi:acetolactate synthase-1/2/3 large subunit